MSLGNIQKWFETAKGEDLNYFLKIFWSFGKAGSFWLGVFGGGVWSLCNYHEAWATL